MKLFMAAVAVVGTALVVIVVSDPARAQIVEQYFPTDLPAYESDITLPMPDHDPRVAHGQGFRVDGLTIGTSASEAVGYDSAPLGSFGRSSPTVVTGANVSLNSDWSRGAIGAQIGVDDHRYTSTPIANYTNWNTALGGSLNIGRDRVSLGYDHINQNLAPTELGVLGITAPVPYSDDDERLTVDIPFSRFRLTPAFEHQQFSFSNLLTPIPLNYSTNDHDIWSGALTGVYALSKGRNLVAMIRGTSADYVRNGTFSRNDYNDVIGFVGVNIQANAVIGIRALIGAESRDFRFQPSQTSTIPTAELDLTWQPTRLTTVLLWFSREFQDPTFPFASTEVTTSGRAEIEHSIRRNVELRGFVSVGSSNYGTDNSTLLTARSANSSQLLTTLGFEGEWTVNRHIALKLDYNHNINNFSGQVAAFTTPLNAIRSYSQNSATLNITIQR